MTLVEQPWFRQHGFHGNPFSIKPAAFHNEIIGYRLDVLIELVRHGGAAFVEAPLGSGKTSILKHLLARFGGKRKVIYYNHITAEPMPVGELLRRTSVRSRLLGTLPVDMILLVDEADDFTRPEGEDVLRFVDQGHIRSVVFFGTKYRAGCFPQAMQQRMSGNIVKLGMLTPEQAVELVRKRVGDIPLLSDDLVKQIFVRVDYRPRRLLEVCEDVCQLAVAADAQNATTAHVDAVLGVSKALRRRQKKTDVAPHVIPVSRKKSGKRRDSPKGRGTPRTKKRPAASSVVIHEIDSTDNFNLDNIRTYEEEMSLAKPDDEKV